MLIPRSFIPRQDELPLAEIGFIRAMFDKSKGLTAMNYPYDQPGIYAIHVAGEVDTSWSDILGGLTIAYAETGEKGDIVETILSGSLPDQAALFGVLNTLYDFHFPMLSVNYLGPG